MDREALVLLRFPVHMSPGKIAVRLTPTMSSLCCLPTINAKSSMRTTDLHDWTSDQQEEGDEPVEVVWYSQSTSGMAFVNIDP